jgi:hypothetical protein
MNDIKNLYGIELFVVIKNQYNIKALLFNFLYYWIKLMKWFLGINKIIIYY